MSSGFSYSGGRPRCFVYWQEFQKCYIQTDNPVECRPQCGDYLNCLHFSKQKKPLTTTKQDKNEHEHSK